MRIFANEQAGGVTRTSVILVVIQKNVVVKGEDMYLSVTTITVVLNVTQALNIDITAKNFSSIIVYFSTALRVKRDQQAHALTAAPVSTRIIPALIPARPALRPRTLQLQVPH